MKVKRRSAARHSTYEKEKLMFTLEQVIQAIHNSYAPKVLEDEILTYLTR